MEKGRKWTRDESLIAFRLYCALPFGKLNHQNPDIIQLAEKLDRIPSSMSMKACNFARLDPLHQARGIAGLAHGAKLEETIWQQFNTNSEAIAIEAEAAYEQVAPTPGSSPGMIEEQGGLTEEGQDAHRLELLKDFRGPVGPTEAERTVRTRRVRGFFRRAVLTSYGHRWGREMGYATVENDLETKSVCIGL